MNRKMQMMMAMDREREDVDYRMRDEYNTARNEYNGSARNYGVEGRFRGDEQRDHRDEQMTDAYDEMEPRGYKRDRRGRFRSEMNMDYGADAEMDGYGEMVDRDDDDHRPPVYEVRNHYRKSNKIGFVGGEKPVTKQRGKRKQLDMEMAEEWMENLCNADGSEGPRWSIERVKRMMGEQRMHGNLLEYYVVMNSLCADYCKVFRKHGIGAGPDFFMDMAKAFIEDEDAVDGKVVEYYEHIVK